MTASGDRLLKEVSARTMITPRDDSPALRSAWFGCPMAAFFLDGP
jgi:hypothetical protein